MGVERDFQGEQGQVVEQQMTEVVLDSVVIDG